ncbi:hypothetical protein B0J11DRAFT_537691 [Dendryphion nanum]|uniref:Secreted protein n=1 Tax=Dendryphion nanum TaxID=256645 RepID=A0A9P9DCJ0_9PLEO|nr:hypothetical protein B0J11DRAFT_537691 [Dendryphion nanum]
MTRMTNRVLLRHHLLPMIVTVAVIRQATTVPRVGVQGSPTGEKFPRFRIAHCLHHRHLGPVYIFASGSDVMRARCAVVPRGAGAEEDRVWWALNQISLQFRTQTKPRQM